MKLYLAYGSNLNKEQMSYRCPDAVPVGKTRIPNYGLVFRRGYLTIEPKQGASVPVGVWQISAQDEKNLDRYEGYPKFYYKHAFPILLHGYSSKDDFTAGKAKITEKVGEALAYIMADGYPIMGPSDSYYNIVRQGYIDFDFDHDDFDHLWKAMAYALRKSKPDRL